MTLRPLNAFRFQPSKPGRIAAVLLMSIAVLVEANASVLVTNLATVSIGPGETAFGLSVPQFNPANYPATPVLLQVQVSLQASWNANLSFIGTSVSNSVAYSLSPAVVTASPRVSGTLSPGTVNLGLAGSTTVSAGSVVSLPVTVTGSQSRTASDTAALAAFSGSGSLAYDIDFSAQYPAYLTTQPADVTGLFGNDRVLVNLEVHYLAAPLIAVGGQTNFVYAGMAQGPATVTVLGTTSRPTLSYMGINGTGFGPSATAPSAAGAYSVIASVVADANYPAAVSTPLTFTISPAPLTVAGPSLSKTYGTTLSLSSYPSNFTTVGLVHGETVGTVTLMAGGGLSADAATGTYPVVPSAATGGTFVASNYSVTYLPGALVVNPGPSSIRITGATSFNYTGSPIGPLTAEVTGSGGAVEFSYSGTGGTVYANNSVLPTQPGTYQAVATVSADANHLGAVSDPWPFSIVTLDTTQTDVPLLPPWGIVILIVSMVGFGTRNLRGRNP